MEMITGGLHTHDEKIGQIQSNLTLIGDQVLQSATQLSGYEAKMERLERIVGSGWKIFVLLHQVTRGHSRSPLTHLVIVIR